MTKDSRVTIEIPADDSAATTGGGNHHCAYGSSTTTETRSPTNGRFMATCRIASIIGPTTSGCSLKRPAESEGTTGVTTIIGVCGTCPGWFLVAYRARSIPVFGIYKNGPPVGDPTAGIATEINKAIGLSLTPTRVLSVRGYVSMYPASASQDALNRAMTGSSSVVSRTIENGPVCLCSRDNGRWSCAFVKYTTEYGKNAKATADAKKD